MNTNSARPTPLFPTRARVNTLLPMTAVHVSSSNGHPQIPRVILKKKKQKKKTNAVGVVRGFGSRNNVNYY